jgi:glutathione-independent formaldehyde dehydrogenase
MAQKNRGVVLEKGGVSVQEFPFPKLEIEINGQRKPLPHGVILKVLLSNICGSDMHMVRGRTEPGPGLRLGHEITGEVYQKGSDVEFLEVGDWVSVPFNVACGRCRNCIERNTHICLNVNPRWPGGAYGYVGMGPWPGGQAEYVVVPYADFNLLKFPKNAPKDKLLDIALLSDIFPTAYDGAKKAGVTTGMSVYIAGAGPVGLCCVASCKLLGASYIFCGDFEQGRLDNAAKLGAIPVNLGKEKLQDKVKATLGKAEVDCGVDCVGFESCGPHGQKRTSDEERSEVLNTIFSITKFGGGVGIPGLYLPADPGAATEYGKKGMYLLDFGNAWNKSLFIQGGQCPVMKWNRLLLEDILAGRTEVAKYLNPTVISLDEAPQAYKMFNEGVPKKFIIDPHGSFSGTPLAK